MRGSVSDILAQSYDIRFEILYESHETMTRDTKRFVWRPDGYLRSEVAVVDIVHIVQEFNQSSRRIHSSGEFRAKQAKQPKIRAKLYRTLVILAFSILIR